MSLHLLDVNVLLALCDAGHVHHEAAHRWFAKNSSSGWATCPLTENAFIRIAGQPSYPNSPGSPHAAAMILREFCLDLGHVFWPDSLSLLDSHIFNLQKMVAPNQGTDIYLLGLAVARKGKLATFDRRIPAAAVRAGEEALEIITG